MKNFLKSLWNPVAFWISLIMSLLMPLIFAVIPYFISGNGLSLEMCLLMWPPRWLVAYLLIVVFVQSTGFKLAMKTFNFKP